MNEELIDWVPDLAKNIIEQEFSEGEILDILIKSIEQNENI
jgi:hypothetical protein